MTVRFHAAAWAFAAWVWASAAGAGQIRICDVQPNIDYACENCNPTATALPIAVFDFSKQPGMAALTSLTGLEFTMSMQTPVSSASGLRLALNGIDTGIALDGFDFATLKEQTFKLSENDANWLTPDKESALLASLQASNGEVTASILANKPEDLKLQLYSDTNVKLCLDGLTPDPREPVPEPGALMVWGAAAAAVAWRRLRA
jgi:hypothetical protein